MNTQNRLPYLAGTTEVHSYQDADEILRSMDFAAGEFEEESLPFRARTLLTLNGREHLDRRRLEARLFVKPVLDQYEDSALEPAFERCMDELQQGAPTDSPLQADLVRFSRRTFVQVAATLIGFDGVEEQDRLDTLLECVYRTNEAIDVKFSTRDHSEVVREGLEAKRRLRQLFFEPSIRRRSRMISRSSGDGAAWEDEPLDLLTILLMHRQEDWDDDLLLRESILYLAGATDTTTNAVTHAINDLFTWLDGHPGDRDQLRNPDFIRGVCNEALRLHPNVTALVRRAKTKTTLSTGRTFDAGEHVALMFNEINRDPDAFGPSPGDFDPWRTVPYGTLPYGLIFGAGPHVCIGRPMMTPVSGEKAAGDNSQRAMFKLVQSLLMAGIRPDPEREPRYVATEEPMFAVLPVVFTSQSHQ